MNGLTHWSFPLWERGLKLAVLGQVLVSHWVVPLVGTWIEILFPLNTNHLPLVVPLVGTWIEIAMELLAPYHQYGRSPCGNVD